MRLPQQLLCEHDTEYDDENSTDFRKKENCFIIQVYDKNKFSSFVVLRFLIGC